MNPSLLRSSLRSLATIATVAAALTIGTLATPAAAAGDADTETDGQAQDQAETREVVDLELRIADEGKAIGRIAQLVELDTDTALALEADGHEHAVAITVRKADERGRKLAATLSYQRDGQAVMETVTIEAKAKKAQVVRTESGVALSLQLATKTVTADEVPPPAPRRPQIEIVEDTNDPLAGL